MLYCSVVVVYYTALCYLLNMSYNNSRKGNNMPQETIDGPAGYTTIRVTGDVLARLRDMQAEFSSKTNGGTITQSAIIKKGLDLVDSTGTLAAQGI